MADLKIDMSGVNDVIKSLEEVLGEAAIQRAVDRALKAGADAIAEIIAKNFESFEDTGASIEEITVGEPQDTRSGIRYIPIHWKGPKQRYRLIHLNEYGTIKNPNPRGKGAVARSLREGERVYRQTLIDELQGALVSRTF